jgi:hypothetical protein
MQYGQLSLFNVNFHNMSAVLLRSVLLLVGIGYKYARTVFKIILLLTLTLALYFLIIFNFSTTS